MEETINATTSAHGGDIANYCREHNNRTIIAENVYTERTANNKITCDCSLSYVYQEAFEKRWREYQSGQRESRQISASYFEHCVEKYNTEKKRVTEKKTGNTKIASPVHEFILQFGDKDTFGYGSGNENVAENILQQQIKAMQNDERFLFLTPDYIATHPSWGNKLFEAGKDKLLVIGCYTHKDEATVHTHFDIVHYHINKTNRGCAVSNAITKTQEALGLRKKREENYLLDNNGKKIQATNKDGSLRFDENGSPIYKMQKLGKIATNDGEVTDNTQGLYLLYEECRQNMAAIAQEQYGISRKAGKAHEHINTQTYQTAQEFLATAKTDADITRSVARKEAVKTIEECAMIKAAVAKEAEENNVQIGILENEIARLREKINHIYDAINYALQNISTDSRKTFIQRFKEVFSARNAPNHSEER